MFNQNLTKMSKRILTDKERKELLAKYKADKLNDAPANITDATLIKNYGSDEQKALLETAPKSDEGKKNETPGASQEQPGNTSNPGAGEPGLNSGTPGNVDLKREFALREYQELHGVDFASTIEGGNIDDIPTTEIEVFNITKKNEIERDSNTDSPEYVTELNNYISLNDGKAPESQLKLSELKRANAQKILDLQAASATSKKESIATLNANSNPANPNLQSTITNKNPEKVTLVNTETRQVKKFTKHTYENYLKNDPNWTVAPEAPDEVKDLI